MKKISALFFFLFILVCAHAQASTVNVTWDDDKLYSYKSQKYWEKYVTQFDVTLDGISTYGYCVAPTVTIDPGDYSYSFLDWTTAYLQAAWLMDKYSPTETENGVISVQSAIWTTVTGDAGYAPKNNKDYQYDDLYKQYITALKNVTIDQTTASYLMENYKIMYTYIGNNEYQTLIIKYASTPVPAAAWLLGSGVIGLLGYRRYQA